MLLALRCGSTEAAVKAYYDERPAIVSLAREFSTLRLIPLAEDCDNCSSFYHIEFSQTLKAVGARLLELRVSDSNDNPCCDGGDQKRGDRLVILRLPEGEQVLVVNEMTEEISHDDSVEDGDSDAVCNAKIDYSRDAGGNVESIRTEIRCTENKKPEPGIKRQGFRWNAGARRFDELKESSRSGRPCAPRAANRRNFESLQWGPPC